MKNLSIFILAILTNAAIALALSYGVEISLTVLTVDYIPYDSGNLPCAFEVIRILCAIVTAVFLIYAHNPILNFLNNRLGAKNEV